MVESLANILRSDEGVISGSTTGFLVPPRRDLPELMDQPGQPVAEVEDAHRQLNRINCLFGNARTARREWDRTLDRWDAEGRHARRRDALDPPIRSVLDVGSGSGDLLRLLADQAEARGRSIRPVALDWDAIPVATAIRSGVPAVRGDALRLPVADRAFDLVMAVKFAHHFSGAALARLFDEMVRVARSDVLILDIRRHLVAYHGFRLWSRVFTNNRLVQYDGPLSVLRGFVRPEMAELAARCPDFNWSIRHAPGFQIILRGERQS